MKKTILNNAIIRASVLGGILAAGCTEKPVDVNKNPGEWEMQVTGVTAAYDRSRNRVLLSWQPPATSDFHFYRVYRTNSENIRGTIDTNTLESSERRLVIPRDSTSFTDVPGLDNGTFYYAVRAARAVQEIVQDSVVNDTILGRMSNIASCVVGVEVSFNINRGDVYTVTDECTLVVNDPATLLRRVRFTQVVDEALVDTATGEKVYITYSDPTDRPLESELKSLIAGGWLTNILSPADGKEARVIVNFDKPDGLNTSTEQAAGDAPQVTHAWTLKQGNGAKRVYAELEYYDAAKDTSWLDTLYDDISIRPWRAAFSPKNRFTGSDRTMSKGRTFKRYIGNVNTYTLFKPYLRFGLSIFADTTFARDFDYWVVFSKINVEVDKTIRGKIYAWHESSPRRGLLTGYGPEHDENYIYEYSIDTSSLEGRENLERLIVTYPEPDVEKGIFRFQGTEEYNECAVPGSYWGANPATWDKTGKRFKSVHEIIKGTPALNYDSLVHLNKGTIWSAGVKRCWLIVRFKGRYFNDVRTFTQNPEDVGFDLYPPRMQVAKSGNPHWINEGDIITSKFSYRLGIEEGSGVIRDLGSADIREISLIVAQKPDSLEWLTDLPDSLGQNQLHSEKLTLERLTGFRHFLYPFNIEVKSPTIENVEWIDIDPSDWPTGDYIMAVISADEYGNRGFAPMGSDGTNPWLVHVLTGK